MGAIQLPHFFVPLQVFKQMFPLLSYVAFSVLLPVSYKDDGDSNIVSSKASAAFKHPSASKPETVRKIVTFVKRARHLYRRNRDDVTSCTSHCSDGSFLFGLSVFRHA